MDPDGQSLLRLLFNEGETVCVSNNEFGFHSIPLQSALNGEIELKSPNEATSIKYCDSSELMMVAINPINGYRRDCQVTAFRTYLIEIDFGTIKEQLGTIANTKMPFSGQIFSGNKSVHTVIVLDEDLKDEKQYRYIGDWIFNIATWADQNCKNPSRSVRIPGAYREEGKKQRLINIRKRITIKELMEWLNRYRHLQPQIRAKKEVPLEKADSSRLSPWVCVMLNKGIDTKNGRNQTWFSIAVDFALAGFSEEDTIEELGKRFTEDHDFREKEWLASIASGFRYANEK